MEGYYDCSQNLGMPIKMVSIKIVNCNKDLRAAGGTHTNDAESEVSRFKLWSRGKWSKVRTLNSRSSEQKQTVLKKHVDDYYVLQTNVGDQMMLKMSHLMEAFRLLDGGHGYKPVKICS